MLRLLQAGICDGNYLTICHLFAITGLKLTIKKDCILFKFSEEFPDADCLSSSNRDKDNGDKEIPDEKVEGEEELAGPKDLADGHVHIHSLARVDICF